jgi:hypothetical protein
MQSNARPFGGSGQDNDGDLSSHQILLVANPLVGGEQKLNRRFLRRPQQRAVIQAVPTSCFGCHDGVTSKREQYPEALRRQKE